MSALDSIASKSALSAAWTDVVRRKRHSPSFSRIGLNGESLYSFERYLERNIADVSSRLRSKSFGFSELEPTFVPKNSTEYRLISIPTVADRVVQRAILNFLRPRNGWMANGISYGFVPDLSVEDAITKALQLRDRKSWVFKTDITRFFDRIDRGLLTERLQRRIRHRSLLPLIDAAMNCEINAPTPDVKSRLKKAGIRRGVGVRQGMPMSPYFANVMLEPFDKKCVNYAFDAIRYADDIAFFCSSERQARDAEEFCRAELSELGLSIPALEAQGKTRIYPPSEAAEFLGLEMAAGSDGYQMRVSAAQMTKIKERIHAYGNIAELRRRRLNITRFGNALEAAVQAYAAAYENCSNLHDLTQHLAACKANAIKKAMLALGVNISNLGKDARWFLGVSN